VQEGIMEGARTHPETIGVKELYARDVEPALTPEQRQRYAEQAQRINERDTRHATRRAPRVRAALMGHGRRGTRNCERRASAQR
jgi:hypothetical protein